MTLYTNFKAKICNDTQTILILCSIVFIVAAHMNVHLIFETVYID